MRSLSILAGTALLATLVAGCGDDGKSDNPLEAPKPSGSASSKTITVGSAAFPESELLAEIYAGALEAKGVTVKKQLKIGEREAYYKLIENGTISFFPEYNGALLAYLDPKGEVPATAEDTTKALTGKLPASLKILAPSPAEDNDSLTVTQETATKHNLKTLDDLKPVAKDFTVGGPATFEQRFKEKFSSVYGLTFKGWTPDRSGGGNIPTWLKSDKVQIGNVFTTSPAIVTQNLVVLEDPKHVFGFQNITPLVRADAVDATAEGVINGVSAKLTTEDLLKLVKEIAIDKKDAASVAKEWLAAHP
ncbi:ABC transporter substrate-binding protein [Actinocorallia longicatena]|uniref:ABC transporter substrate-binding protein n=1 Tax=Actinocorallia longicatena TaxID=111803 RepID=A0ABP6Q0H6_9ACTN